MANLIQVSVYQDLSEKAPAAVPQLQQISVSKILRVVPDTSVATAVSRIELQYHDNNQLRSRSLWVSETPAAITTASNA